MEIGRRRLKAALLVDQLEQADNVFKKAFPNLAINIVVPHPYNMVRVTAYRDATNIVFEEEHPVDGFPPDHLIAKLALIA